MDRGYGKNEVDDLAPSPASAVASPLENGSSFVKRGRLNRLAADAAESRLSQSARAFAIGIVAFYNVVGVLDVVSTIAAIGVGAGEEANPVVRAMMAHLGPGWIIGKLLVQVLISVMVLWFPHRLVLTIFTAAVMFNGLVVLNNFRIAASL